MAQLTGKEFSAMPQGTKAKMVKCYDGNTGNLCDRTFVLLDDPDLESELEDARQVADGYFTETWNVTRK